MKIVADENIPFAEHFFSGIGSVTKYPGRSIDKATLREADILLVRSVTQVNKELLDGSEIKFVGTATIGCDHMDTDYLDSAGIAYANAPGCNAVSVVEYVLSCLSVLSERFGFDLTEKSVGIVGKGQIGSRLKKVLTGLGLQVKCNDPLLETKGEQGLCSLEEALACDIVSLHVPLTEIGLYPTSRLLNAERIAALSEMQIVINTSRGEVIDESALLESLRSGKGPQVVLDVWNNEPSIDAELAAYCELATPHIAGYSMDGKCRGTEMIYQQLCRYLGLPVRHKLGQFLSDPSLRKLCISPEAGPNWALHTAVRACYDVRRDDSALRNALLRNPSDIADSFDRLRKEYWERRAFERTKVDLKGGRAELISVLKTVGFKIKD